MNRDESHKMMKEAPFDRGKHRSSQWNWLTTAMTACALVALGCGDDATGPGDDVDTDQFNVSVVSSVDLVMAVGRTVQLVATVTNQDGIALSGASLSWRSSNDAIATVSASGLVTALKAGHVTVTAAHNGFEGNVPLTVIDADLDAILELRDDPLMNLLVGQLSGDLAVQLTAALNDLEEAVTVGNCMAVHDALETALNNTSGACDPSDVVTLAVLGLVLERANDLLGMNK